MAHTLFEVHVKIAEIAPPIWRTIELAGSSTLEELHFALQIALGWTNSHLHQFVIGGATYGMTHVEGNDAPGLRDERAVRLQDVAAVGDAFAYEYDFGDGWEHTVTVTAVRTVAKRPNARCTAGARACPPEDCGGPGGYADLLAILADPRHPEHRDRRAWAGDFQPERFALPPAGRDLAPEMRRLRELASGDDGDERDERGRADPALNLPRALVDAVMALEPMQRATLCALIAGSLATDLVEAVDLLAAAAQQLRPTPRRHATHGPRRPRG